MRIGAVSYLNTKPLVYQWDSNGPDELVFDLPSRLADQLSQGLLDVALIPTLEFFQDPEYVIVSDACIACRGPVMSVKLLSRVPFAQIRTLALDEGSRTSAGLVRVLLRQRFGLRPETAPLPIGADPLATSTDAILLIGDRAMHPPEAEFPYQWDLGDQWCRWTELPFVFAMWTARRGVGLGDLAERLSAARDRGVRHLAAIAEQEAAQVQLSEETCLGYLRDNLHFYLGPRERQGLSLYRHYLQQMKIVSVDGVRAT